MTSVKKYFFIGNKSIAARQDSVNPVVAAPANEIVTLARLSEEWPIAPTLPADKFRNPTALGTEEAEREL